MMNTMKNKSPNLVSPIPGRNDEIRDEEIGNDDAASPIPMNDPNSLPLAPAVLIEEHNTHKAEEERLPTQNSEESHSKKTDSRFNPFRPIHPQCNHISYGCLTMVFLVFVGMAVLLKTYLPDILKTALDGFYFVPFMDSWGYDIENSNAESVLDYAEECYADPECKGFNTNGWLKYKIKPYDEWYRWTEDASKGLYVKKA